MCVLSRTRIHAAGAAVPAVTCRKQCGAANAHRARASDFRACGMRQYCSSQCDWRKCHFVPRCKTGLQPPHAAPVALPRVSVGDNGGLVGNMTIPLQIVEISIVAIPVSAGALDGVTMRRCRERASRRCGATSIRIMCMIFCTRMHMFHRAR